MCDSSYQLPKIGASNSDPLVEFLKENGFGSEVYQIFADQEFDVEGFMELTELDFKELFPSKLGTVKKLRRVQQIGKATFQLQQTSTTETNDLQNPTNNVAPLPKPRTKRSPAIVSSTMQDVQPSLNSWRMHPTSPESDINHISITQENGYPYQQQQMSYSHDMPLLPIMSLPPVMPLPPSTAAVNFANPDCIDLSTLSCDDFVAWLSAKKFSVEHCQAFKANNVSGSVFLDLDKNELKDIVKQVGTIRELQNIQEQQRKPKNDGAKMFTDPLINTADKMTSSGSFEKGKNEYIKEPESLAVRMKNDSTPIINNQTSKIPTYKLPIKQTMRNDKKGIAKCVLGTPMPGQHVTERVLMVVGATGAGKTTLINGMANYIFGVQWKDNFRFMLVTENTAKNQAHSQTDLITAYTIYPTHGSNFKYALTIVDTPGFGDTRGLERDKVIIQQIQEFFSIKDGNGIDHLDGIGFVAQASLARLTPIQNYVFHSILSVFGNDVANNLFIMVTFADGQDPPVMAAISEAKIECKKHYKFNNSALFASNEQSADDDDEVFDKMFWKMGFVSFKKFFDEFTKAEGVSLYLTKEVLRERKQLEVTVQSLQQQISAGVAKLEELRQEEIILQQREAEVATNKDFKYTVEVTKQRKIDLPTGKYVTNCLVCNYTCHNNCAFADDKDKYRCSAMDNGGEEDAKCRICPQKCYWQKHVNNPYCFETYKEKEERTSEELQEKYKTALQGKSKVEAILNQINYYLLAVEDDVINKVDEVQRALQRLDKIALKQSPLTQVEHLDLLMEAEKQEAKPGYQSRIKIYEKAKQDAQILETAKNNPEQFRILKEKRKNKIEEAKKNSHAHGKSWFNPLRYW